MAKLALIETDYASELKGRWFVHPVGYRFLLARYGNPRFEEAYLEALNPYIEKIRANASLTEEEDLAVTLPCIARYVILDWSDIEDEAGNPIPYSPEKALEILSNPDLHEIRDWVKRKSSAIDGYRKKLNEEAVKN